MGVGGLRKLSNPEALTTFSLNSGDISDNLNISWTLQDQKTPNQASEIKVAFRSLLPLKRNVYQILPVNFYNSIVNSQSSIPIYSTARFNSLHQQSPVFSGTIIVGYHVNTQRSRLVPYHNKICFICRPWRRATIGLS